MSDTAASTRLRFAIASELARMRYGDTKVITAQVVMEAFPPTGEHDRSFAGTFQAMALSLGGNRPETSYTSVERVQNDLPDDGSFLVEEDYEGNIRIHRLLRCCPHCHGEGWRYKCPATKITINLSCASAPTSVTIERIECTHEN